MIPWRIDFSFRGLCVHGDEISNPKCVHIANTKIPFLTIPTDSDHFCPLLLLIRNSYILTTKTASFISFNMLGAESCLLQKQTLKHYPPAFTELMLLGNRCHMYSWVHTGVGWVFCFCSHDYSWRRHLHRHSWRALCEDLVSDSIAKNSSEQESWEKVFPSDMQRDTTWLQCLLDSTFFVLKPLNFRGFVGAALATNMIFVTSNDFLLV